VPTQINGLPAHVLLIHVLIAAVPLAALFVVLHAAWPAARRRLGIVTPLVALVALIFVPITTHAGEWLKSHLQVGGVAAQRINHHADLGRTLLPLVGVLFLAAVGVWYLGRRFEFGIVPDRTSGAGSSDAVSPSSGGGATATAVRTQPRAQTRTELPTWASAAIAVVAVVVAVVNVVQLYRIGDSGAQAVWNGVVQPK
jgi:hypothetical protein